LQIPGINPFELIKDSSLWNLESVDIDSNEIIDVHYRCSTFIARICEPILSAGATDGLGHLSPNGSRFLLRAQNALSILERESTDREVADGHDGMERNNA
jgi:hypothetical protein